uniref:Thiolase N-terminal domain-containing protein n=1 Tax=Chrysotila carterae TaxID=13221 RepID=A0A7S4B1N8_CHRCT
MLVRHRFLTSFSAHLGVQRRHFSEVCIVGAARTPIGGFNGSLSSFSAPSLGALAITGALTRSGLSADLVQQVWMGNVLSAGLGQAPARQAALLAKLPDSACCTTINKVCSSGIKAVVLGAQQIMLGQADVIVAGGMESMSNAPYYLPKARWGHRMGHGQVVDGMITDGLWDVYDDCHMGSFAELCAETLGIDRAEQDAHADESYARARAAHSAGHFASEVEPVVVSSRKGSRTVDADEEPQTQKSSAAEARPAFKKVGGTVTAANASTLSDGAAALVLMSRDAADAHGATVLATIKGYADAEQAPSLFTTAPALAIPKAVENSGLQMDQVDFFEINEAFSVVAVANSKLLGLPAAQVRVVDRQTLQFGQIFIRVCVKLTAAAACFQPAGWLPGH